MSTILKHRGLRKRIVDVPAAAAVPSAIQPWTYPGMVVWYEASKETAYIDDDLVGTMTDQTSNALNATAAGANRPTFKTAILNGKAVYRFLGDDLAQTAAFSLRRPILFIVSRVSNNGCVCEFAFNTLDVFSFFTDIAVVIPTNMLLHFKPAGTASVSPSSAGDHADNVWRNLRLSTSGVGSTTDIYFNNKPVDVTDGVADPGNALITDTFGIGGRINGSLFITGDIAILGIAERTTLTPEQEQLTNDYIVTQSGIADDLWP